jgi:hypothetical protein
MGLTYSDGDKFLDAAPIPPARPAAADVAGGSPICNAPPLAATLGLDSGMTTPIIRAMSASRELQRQLKRLELCLPRPAKQPPTGPGWIHKIKHDGFRILAEREATGVTSHTRRGYDFAGRFPLAAAAVAKLPVKFCLMDGEAMVCDGRGLAVFDLLGRRWHGEDVILPPSTRSKSTAPQSRNGKPYWRGCCAGRTTASSSMSITAASAQAYCL